MKSLLLLLAVVGTINFASAGYVNGYYKKDGTYVEGHYRSDPNNTTDDNYNTEGNTNPYTGEIKHPRRYR